MIRLWWLLFLLIPAAHALEPLGNRLAGHPSPYLAQHGEDPVAWQEWNPETLARARRENKPLLVSLGYFACHWCHVMQRESYRDPAIAALINRHFIPVKVDRELNPGLDAALVEFSRRLNGAAGWPLNAFVTPDGHPFFATLYQPPARFRALLERLAEHWRADSAGIRDHAREARQPRAAAEHPLPAEAGDLERATDRFLDALRAQGDFLQGGFGQQSRFPHAPRLLALLEVLERGGGDDLEGFLRLTLDVMARQLRDPVRGGFFRYATDPDWSTPHFEKMLADNVQLALLYARAAEALQQPRYRRVAHETLDFLLEQLASPDGAFFTSLSALDAQGREGGAYLWRPEELRRLLGAETYAQVRRAWKLDAPSSFPGGVLPRPGLLPEETEQAVFARLKAAARPVPRDEKIDAGLNGLALAAFSRAGRGEPRFEAAARRLRGYIETRLLRDGQAVKAVAGGRVWPEGELDDHAYLARGLLDYHLAFADPQARRLARDLAARAWSRFHTAQGWRREARPLLAVLTDQDAIPDDALPSPSALLLAPALADAAPAAALNLALAHAARRARIDPLKHGGVLAALRERFR